MLPFRHVLVQGGLISVAQSSPGPTTRLLWTPVGQVWAPALGLFELKVRAASSQPRTCGSVLLPPLSPLSGGLTMASHSLEWFVGTKQLQGTATTRKWLKGSGAQG